MLGTGSVRGVFAAAKTLSAESVYLCSDYF